MIQYTKGKWRVTAKGLDFVIMGGVSGKIEIADAIPGMSEVEYIANARLMAAAPEMYEALNSFPMLLAPATSAWGKEVQEWQHKAIASVAKAGGK